MAGYNTIYDSSYGRHHDMDTSGSIKTQRQLQHSLEASKEMIYKIHGNVINILEELEERIQKKNGRQSLPKSSTDYYDHREKCDDTVDEVVQAQLLALEAVLKGCDPRVKEFLRKELADKTNQWIAVRQHKGVPRDIVDTYAERTLEVITKGKTTHAREFLDSKSKDFIGFSKDDAEMLLHANQKASEVGEKFQKNPELKAKGPDMRTVGEEIPSRSLKPKPRQSSWK